MQNFTLEHPRSLDDAIALGPKDGAKYIAGGTDLMQLAKDNVEAPRQMIDLEGLLPNTIKVSAKGALQLGALARMVDVANNADVRAGWPAVSEALLLSASPQIRNMGTMGGNLLQRTRCGYFRDTGFACNKRIPGSGCPAIAGESRGLGVVGVSDHCIATHPSDMPVALMAMDASVRLQAPSGGTRIVPLTEFYRLPGDTPQIETNLVPGELITGIIVPPSGSAKNLATSKSVIAPLSNLPWSRRRWRWISITGWCGRFASPWVASRRGLGVCPTSRQRCMASQRRRRTSRQRPSWQGRAPRPPRTTHSRSS